MWWVFGMSGLCILSLSLCCWLVWRFRVSILCFGLMLLL